MIIMGLCQYRHITVASFRYVTATHAGAWLPGVGVEL
jgi:hypothetical protein